jgi:putative protein kinase ArgK-like GTPase of G3E family
MVKRSYLQVVEYPKGLDYKPKHFENQVLLQQYQSKKPQILGIWGLDGVGKTTLEKNSSIGRNHIIIDPASFFV